MNTKLRWGLLATGSIARTFARGVLESHTGVLAAVGSRTQESAEKFAAEFSIPRAHGSYEALLADPGVDAVYISTPHPMHAEWAIKAARAGKHILCEKPLTMSHAEALAVIEAARAADVFLMEAFMYRCHPQTARVVELVKSGALGEVRHIEASFGFRSALDLAGRHFSRALGGGGILDVGCYPVSMARLIAGVACGKPFAEPVKMSTAGHIGAESGVDEYATAMLEFPGGILAQIGCGVRLQLDNQVRIHGTEGRIRIPSPWIIPREADRAVIFLNDQEIITETDRGVYALEADEVAAHITARQSPAMSWADTLGNMAVLDQWRATLP